MNVDFVSSVTETGLKVVYWNVVLKKLITLVAFVHTQRLVMFSVVKLIPLILLLHCEASFCVAVLLVMKITLLIGKALEALRTPFVKGLLVSIDSAKMTCYHKVMMGFIYILFLNQLQVRHIHIHFYDYLSDRAPKLSIDFKGLFRLRVLQNINTVFYLAYDLLAVHICVLLWVHLR